MWTHWTVRTYPQFAPFEVFDVGRFAWMQLTSLFPDQIALMLMPNHFHIVLPETQSPDRIQHRLGGVMGAVNRHLRTRNLWEPIPPPRAVPDRLYMLRTVRYVALNPCRKNLCSDPLEWIWSTYRDVMGAITIPNLTSARLARAAGRKAPPDFPEWLHQYVSSDPSVQVQGTPFPNSSPPTERSKQSITEILFAAASAMRFAPEAIERRGPLRPFFVHLAARHGWNRTSDLAEICRTDLTTIQRMLKRAPPTGLAAGDLCLGDARLRRIPLDAA